MAYECVGTNAIIERLSRYGALDRTSFAVRVRIPRPWRRRLYWDLLDLLDQQPELTYCTISDGGFWSWMQYHDVIINGRAGAIQTVFHLLERRHGKQR